MECLDTTLKDARLIKPKIFADSRGFFLESWNQKQYDQIVNNDQPLTFVQDNHSRSSRGVLRGLHLQSQFPQGKLVRVIYGEIYDVIVDLRKHSPTFGHWEGFQLSADNKHLLWVPPGFGHGFYTVSEHAEMMYKCTEYYHPENELTVIWNDKTLNIQWPILDGHPPLLSNKDQMGVSFQEYIQCEIY